MSLFDNPTHLKKYGLRELPYTTNPDERYLFFTDTHTEAINTCVHVIQNREGIGLIVGEQGLGKTSIMRRLMGIIHDDPRFALSVIETAEHVPTAFQLVKEVMESFGESCLGRDTKTRNDQLKSFLIKTYEANIVPILFIDEAQQLQGKLLETLRGYLNFETPHTGKLLQIILFALPTIQRKLKFAPSLRNRLIKTELRPMNYEEVNHMLRWRFTQAGGHEPFPFEEEAVGLLFELSKGNPRTICGLASLALQVGSTRQQPITKDVINAVSHKRFLN